MGRKVLDSLAEAIEAEIDSGSVGEEVDRMLLKDLKQPAASAPPAALVEETAAAAAEKEVSSDSLQGIAKEVAVCKKCALHKTRTNTVPGQGNPVPDIMFIGEAPGADEDAQGFAFVGRAGKLLTKMIEAMGYTRDEVFIGNILKCRPPDNRRPMPDEMSMCLPYLLRQIKVLKPKVIVALGGTAVKGLLKTDTGITKLRGHWTEFEGVPFMPTYHPAYLLRNPSMKKDCWSDLKDVLKKLGRKPPPVKKAS